jgi:hypothetical protein
MWGWGLESVGGFVDVFVVLIITIFALRIELLYLFAFERSSR